VLGDQHPRDCLKELARTEQGTVLEVVASDPALARRLGQADQGIRPALDDDGLQVPGFVGKKTDGKDGKDESDGDMEPRKGERPYGMHGCVRDWIGCGQHKATRVRRLRI